MLDLAYLAELAPVLLSYLPVTLSLAAISAVLALSAGLAISLWKVFKVPGLSQLADIHISFFRGTPLLVQLFLIYYGLPQIFTSLTMSAYTAAVLGLSLHFSAYMAESLRGAIISVPKNQMEAALCVGMTSLQAMRRIILPQAGRAAAPALVNNFIDLLKSTSLAFTLGVTEIMAKGHQEAAGSFRFFETFLLVALIYWLCVSLLTMAQTYTERYLNRAF